MFIQLRGPFIICLEKCAGNIAFRAFCYSNRMEKMENAKTASGIQESAVYHDTWPKVTHVHGGKPMHGAHGPRMSPPTQLLLRA